MNLLPNLGEMGLLKKFVYSILLQRKTEIPEIRVIRQGWGKLSLRQSVTGGVINIGGKTYKHGLGTHAVSEILISLPEDAELFTAEVGFDFNNDTKQIGGNPLCPNSRLIFAVKSHDKVLWKSPPLVVSNKPVKLCVPLKGLREIILEVDDDNTGIAGAHANWADAMITLKDKTTLWVEELPFGMDFQDVFPFSFNLGGVSSREFLPEWTVKAKSNRQKDRILHQISYQEPGGGFEIRCEVIEFLNHAVVEWKLYFKNTGDEKSPTLTQILPLDTRIKVSSQEVKLHYNRGSACNLYDFQPLTELFISNHPIHFNCRGGRSSELHLPFWNLDCDGKGVICGLGWSGSWKARFDCDLTTDEVRMQAGMDGVELYLKPGEEISSPSICLLFWNRVEVIDSHNLFRRFMRNVCIPKWEGKEPLVLAVFGNNHGLEKVSEENQIEIISKISGCGVNTYWIDAGWYQTLTDGGTWASCRGNWFADKKKFPRGLKPVADEAHNHGLKFLLWFDPEVVCPGTAIAKEHPEWVIWKDKELPGLFNLGIPEARKYLTDLISTLIKKYGIDVYRNDFNIDPGEFWEIADEPGRKGMTEIRYVEGLYWFWNQLRKRHPHLLIDNCASGGRRIDYETSKRSVPLWRSDMQCFPNHPLFATFSQNQTYGLSFYLPMHSTGTQNLDIYNFRSVATGSIVVGVPQRIPGKSFQIPLKELKKRFAELKKYHHLFLADFYPLTEFSLREDVWVAYQFYSPEEGEGFALFFRKDNAPYTEAEFHLKALEPKSRYTLTMVDTGKKKTGTGEKIRTVKIKLKKRSSALILIKKQVNPC